MYTLPLAMVELTFTSVRTPGSVWLDSSLRSWSIFASRCAVYAELKRRRGLPRCGCVKIAFVAQRTRTEHVAALSDPTPSD